MPAPTHSPAIYEALAPVYDRWQSAGGMTPFSEVVLAKLLPALDRYGRSAPAPVGSFLDLGCGTGALLLGLAEARPRFRLVGLDGSAGMLDIARGKPGAERVHWIESSLTTPVIPAPPVDAAGCFYDTLNHLPDAAALEATLRGVAAALRPGGLFIFDTTNELGFDRWWRGHRSWRGPGWSVAIDTHPDADQRRAHADVIIEDGDRRTQASLTERCFPDVEVRAALAAAGIDPVLRELWSPFDIDAPGKTWWIGQKR